MEETKVSALGTVTITTEEYRELIEQLMCERNDGNKYRSLYYEKQRECDELNKAYESLIDYKSFIMTNEDVRNKFKLWKLEESEEE